MKTESISKNSTIEDDRKSILTLKDGDKEMGFYSRVPIGKHKDCNGIIVGIYDSGDASKQFVCSHCGKVWGVASDLSDIKILPDQGKQGNSSIFQEFEDFSMSANAPRSVINWLFNDRLRRVLKMLNRPSDTKSVGLDVGCAHGYFTQYMARKLKGTVVGIDVIRNDLYRAKIRTRLRACNDKSISCETIEYVLCNVNHLPFKEGSFNMVTCISVLEHMIDLDRVVEEIRTSMGKNGCLIAGYPMETRLFMALLKVFLPSGLSIRDPKIRGKEKFQTMPETHKQTFTAIRDSLQRHLFMIQRQKSFFTVLPDELSWYECVKMIKKN